jgi:hypothetical protein
MHPVLLDSTILMTVHVNPTNINDFYFLSATIAHVHLVLHSWVMKRLLVRPSQYTTVAFRTWERTLKQDEKLESVHLAP